MKLRCRNFFALSVAMVAFVRTGEGNSPRSEQQALIQALQQLGLGRINQVVTTEAGSELRDDPGETAVTLPDEAHQTAVAGSLLNVDAALMKASKKGQTALVEALLKVGARVASKNRAGGSPLMAASGLGHADTVRVLLRYGADPNDAIDDGDTALLFAAQEGRAAIVKVLLEAEARIATKNSDGCTALMFASFGGHTDVVQVLLQHGADPNDVENEGRTALMLASEEGHEDLIEILLHAGATLDTKDEEGRTALMLASFFGHTDVVQVLLQHRADPNDVENEGRTALMIASQEGQVALVKILLNADAMLDTKDKEGRTALILASSFGHTDVVQLLLQHGADPNGVGEDGFTALMAASQSGHADIAQLLIDRGVSLSDVDEDGMTALIFAVMEGHAEVVRVLLEYGANPNTADEDGHTSLVFASRKGYADTVRLLLSHGATVNIPVVVGSNLCKALEGAAAFGHRDVVYALLVAGSDPSKYNAHGHTASDVARVTEQNKIFSLLNAAQKNRMIPARNVGQIEDLSGVIQEYCYSRLLFDEAKLQCEQAHSHIYARIDANRDEVHMKISDFIEQKRAQMRQISSVLNDSEARAFRLVHPEVPLDFEHNALARCVTGDLLEDDRFEGFHVRLFRKQLAMSRGNYPGKQRDDQLLEKHRICVGKVDGDSSLICAKEALGLTEYRRLKALILRLTAQ